MPGRPVTRVDWVARSVAELQASDPEMAAFVPECDEREAWAPTAPANQGDTTQRAGDMSTRSKGIKKTFVVTCVRVCGISCPFAPVSLSSIHPYR